MEKPCSMTLMLLMLIIVFSQMIIFDQRWVESAEEASAGAELVVEAILEDLQVFFDAHMQRKYLGSIWKVPEKYLKYLNA